MNKLTFEGLAAEVAGTMAVQPDADWNEAETETLAQLHDRLRAHFEAEGITFEYTWCGGGRVYVVDGEYYTPSGARARFLEQSPAPRTGRAIWGPRDAVEHRPRWKTDHHPWAVIGPSGEPNGIRYAGHEVEESTAPAPSDPDLVAPQSAGPRYTVLADGNGCHGVYDHAGGELITSGWSYFEAATLRDDCNARELGLS